MVGGFCSTSYQCDYPFDFRRYYESPTTLKSLALVSIGGVAGTLVRYWLGLVITDSRNGTLTANMIGVALASALLVLMERRGVTELRHLLLPGFCAGLTTFSAVTAQSLEPRDGGIVFLMHNLIFSIMIVIIVLPLARKLIPVRS
ncbi:MAG: hypothetical protein F2830_06230 [Actinobacteria bacterium]|nr:hypothetical protein [Actinomycetota bacterium]MSZ64031.1 hypothetical protein [Actinomycetota bacterium]MTA57958.1 hypothetical protein [Actinomycetota bacterium]